MGINEVILWIMIILMAVAGIDRFTGYHLGLALVPDLMIKSFMWFGRFVIALLTVALVAAGIEGATGQVIISGMEPISTGFALIGNIAVILAGAFALVHLMSKYFGQALA